MTSRPAPVSYMVIQTRENLVCCAFYCVANEPDMEQPPWFFLGSAEHVMGLLMKFYEELGATFGAETVRRAVLDVRWYMKPKSILLNHVRSVVGDGSDG